MVNVQGYPSIINNNIQGLSINYSNVIHAPPGYEENRYDMDMGMQRSGTHINQADYATEPQLPPGSKQ